MILGSLCVLIAACWSSFVVEYAGIKLTSVVRFLLVRIEVLLDRSSSTSISHRVFDWIVLVLALRVGASVLLWVSGFNSEGVMRFLCEIRDKSSDHNRFSEDVRMPRLPPKSKPSLGGCNCCSGDGDGGNRDRDDDSGGGYDWECYPEDEEFDVQTLRRLVKKERRRADAACNELEKERAATATAIDETMAMIARLQGEKNAAEVSANQERRMAEQKQAYDQEVIESLRWMLARSEDRRDILEGRLQRWGRKLEMSDLYDDDKDHDDDDYDYNRVDTPEDLRDLMIISSLEFDCLQPQRDASNQ
ncbi:hypothetical protein MLD38_023245 [Melastoma candidum]|uniref:Uncharacterized protein n=1 Tax=Melastoma candidum TaxID=119954 RepID=A0ACB9QM20_9MYRT|nr:hypothetical protein MLD38_023245 [Melastoma candidum]